MDVAWMSRGPVGGRIYGAYQELDTPTIADTPCNHSSHKRTLASAALNARSDQHRISAGQTQDLSSCAGETRRVRPSTRNSSPSGQRIFGACRPFGQVPRLAPQAPRSESAEAAQQAPGTTTRKWSANVNDPRSPDPARRGPGAPQQRTPNPKSPPKQGPVDDFQEVVAKLAAYLQAAVQQAGERTVRDWVHTFEIGGLPGPKVCGMLTVKNGVLEYVYLGPERALTH